MIPRSPSQSKHSRIWLSIDNTARKNFDLTINYFLIILLITCAIVNSNLDAHQTREVAWKVLSQGGVALISIAHTNEIDNPYQFRLGQCHTQANLSVKGRTQARKIGQEFRGRGVDVGIVLHSRWCRARETAALAFPGISIPEPAMDSFQFMPHNESYYSLKTQKYISTWQDSDALVLITHRENILALTNQAVEEGEAVVLRPFNNNFEAVGKIIF